MKQNRASNAELLIIGGGSAGFAAAIRASDLGARVVMVNEGLIGGTCVNVGCVPSKTLIRAAESLWRAKRQDFAGVQTEGRLADFKAVIEQKRELIEGLRKEKYADVIAGNEKIQVVEGRARFVGPREVEVNGEKIVAEKILIATGASPAVPPIEGIEDVDYLTSDSLFELERLPESVVVIGGRFVALECAQMLARFGCEVTILQRSSRVLPLEDPDVTDALTGYLENDGVKVVTGVSITEVKKSQEGVVVSTTIEGKKRFFCAEKILIAVGRTPNTRGLNLEAAGVEIDSKGFIVVKETLETSSPGIYAAGDVIGEPMFVYTAAYEGSLAAENAMSGSEKRRDYTALPWVIFTDPQLAGVGLSEREAKESGLDFDAVTLPLSYVPRALAARDVRGFIKLLRNGETDELIGARILAPEGGELVMEASLAIKYGITCRELAGTFHPYLTLSEGMKLAALSFEKDPGTLSCCAT